MKQQILRLKNFAYLLKILFRSFRKSKEPISRKRLELHYTPGDKKLFWVAGYTRDENTDSVHDKLTAIAEYAQQFANMVGCKIEDVKTLYNTAPPRYQYMRVFYVSAENPHPEAYVWKHKDHPEGEFYWNMHKVITQ